jgi:DNA-binding CsgD family transcriptional regulator
VSNISQAHGIHGACAAFVIDPLRRETVGERQLMDVYGMTKAEARVAVKASSSRNTSEAGRALGLSQNTVKTHLRRIFTKTDTGGHAELAALLAAIGVVRAAVEDDKSK